MNNERREQGNSGGGRLAEVEQSLAEMKEMLRKLAPDTVFP